MPPPPSLTPIAHLPPLQDAEGCILFDESHKAKNLFPEGAAAEAAAAREEAAAAEEGVSARKVRGLRGKSTKMALAVNALQDQCPGARVVYCSATGASSLPNLAYMSRLGALLLL